MGCRLSSKAARELECVKFWSQQIAVVSTTKSSRGREMKTLLIVTSLSLIGAVAAFAQGPYAGMQTRSIKALSDQQASDLREG